MGTRAGVKVGGTLQFSHFGQVFRDPTSGKVLRQVESRAGTVTITQADEISSVGTFEGTGPVQAGGRVENKR